MSNSTLDDAMAKIQQLIDGFDFDSPGINESIGKDCLHAIAEDIASAAAELQEDPKGVGFPENDPRYAAWKQKRYGLAPPAYGFRTGQTFSIESLLGETNIEGDVAEMAYGTGEPPARASGGGSMTASDAETTDIEKMYFLMNTAKNPIRPYTVGDYARDEIYDIVNEGLRRHLQANGGK